MVSISGLSGAAARKSGEDSPDWIKKLGSASSRQLETALEQPYLMALMVGSLLLSFASFFTTFAGMLHFMPIWLIAFCITFAIQALLFVTSWRIGFALADKEGVPWFSIFVFAICLGSSVFFSWVALFESINDEGLQERTRNTRMHRAVEDTVSQLQSRAIERRRDQVQELLASDVYASWRTSVTTVADRANGARDVLEAALRERGREFAAQIDELERQKARIESDQATSAERLATAQRELQRYEDSRPGLLEKVNRLRVELDRAEEAVVLKEGEMQAEETGGGEGRPAGRGPRWRELRDERNILAARAETTRRLFETARGELASADERIKALKAAAAGEVGGASAQIAAIDSEIETLRKAVSGAGGEGVNLEAEVAQLRANLADFATRFDLEPFDAAAAKCAELLEAMQKNATLASRVRGLSCDTALMAEYMNPIDQAETDLNALTAACSARGPEARNVSAMNFQEATQYGRECVALSGLPAGEVSDLRSEIDRLVLEEDPDASQFVKTVNAFTGGEKLSYFALSIAAAIDFLVLFSGLIGAVSTRPKISQHIDKQSDRQKEENVLRALTVNLDPDPSDTKAVRIAKIVLRSVQPLEAPPPGAQAKEFGFEAKVSMEELADPSAEIDVRQLLVSLCGSEMALAYHEELPPEPGAPADEEPFMAETFAIRTGFLDVLREVIEDHERKMELEDPGFKQRRRDAQRRLAVGGVAQLSAPGAPTVGKAPSPLGDTYTRSLEDGRTARKLSASDATDLQSIRRAQMPKPVSAETRRRLPAPDQTGPAPARRAERAERQSHGALSRDNRGESRFDRRPDLRAVEEPPRTDLSDADLGGARLSRLRSYTDPNQVSNADQQALFDSMINAPDDADPGPDRAVAEPETASGASARRRAAGE